MKPENNPSQQEVNDYQDQMTKQLSNLVEYLRDLLKTRSKDFVLFRLDEIAAESGMENSLKQCIITALENPEKPFIINFKPKS